MEELQLLQEKLNFSLASKSLLNGNFNLVLKVVSTISNFLFHPNSTLLLLCKVFETFQKHIFANSDSQVLNVLVKTSVLYFEIKSKVFILQLLWKKNSHKVFRVWKRILLLFSCWREDVDIKSGESFSQIEALVYELSYPKVQVNFVFEFLVPLFSFQNGLLIFVLVLLQLPFFLFSFCFLLQLYIHILVLFFFLLLFCLHREIII